MHHITLRDLPPPYATPSVDAGSRAIARPAKAWPKVPAGFSVQLYAERLNNPRLLRAAPNGDVFLAESDPGIIKVLRGIDSKGGVDRAELFATGLDKPFGIAFYPPGPEPQWVYVGNTDSVVRFPYRNGDLKAAARRRRSAISRAVDCFGAEATGRATLRSRSMAKPCMFRWDRTPTTMIRTRIQQRRIAPIFSSSIPMEAARRYLPRAFAMRSESPFSPASGELWGSVNERDALGDNLVPDYITHVQPKGFYGWPWWYMGGMQDPRHKGKHPELKDRVITPDVLIQPHNASLEMVFYEGKQFPAELSGRYLRRRAWLMEPIQAHGI